MAPPLSWLYAKWLPAAVLYTPCMATAGAALMRSLSPVQWTFPAGSTAHVICSLVVMALDGYRLGSLAYSLPDKRPQHHSSPALLDAHVWSAAATTAVTAPRFVGTDDC